jgi:hypothetical protein
MGEGTGVKRSGRERAEGNEWGEGWWGGGWGMGERREEMFWHA